MYVCAATLYKKEASTATAFRDRFRGQYNATHRWFFAHWFLYFIQVVVVFQLGYIRLQLLTIRNMLCNFLDVHENVILPNSCFCVANYLNVLLVSEMLN